MGDDGLRFDLTFAGSFAGASGAPVDRIAVDTAVRMDGHPTIRHVSTTGLFLMKCDALRDRALARPPESRDLADIAVLLVGSNLEVDAATRSSEVREHVRGRATWLLSPPSHDRALLSLFGDRFPKPPETAEELAEEAIEVLRRLSK